MSPVHVAGLLCIAGYYVYYPHLLWTVSFWGMLKSFFAFILPSLFFGPIIDIIIQFQNRKPSSHERSAEFPGSVCDKPDNLQNNDALFERSYNVIFFEKNLTLATLLQVPGEDAIALICFVGFPDSLMVKIIIAIVFGAAHTFDGSIYRVSDGIVKSASYFSMLCIQDHLINQLIVHVIIDGLVLLMCKWQRKYLMAEIQGRGLRDDFLNYVGKRTNKLNAPNMA